MFHRMAHPRRPLAEDRHEGRHTLNLGGLRRILAIFEDVLAVFEERQILKSGGLHSGPLAVFGSCQSQPPLRPSFDDATLRSALARSTVRQDKPAEAAAFLMSGTLRGAPANSSRRKSLASFMAVAP